MKTDKRIGLDIDGVICNFAQGVIDKALEMSLHSHFPANWQEVKTWGMSEKFGDIWKQIEQDFNCNLGRQINGGVCPHKESENG